MGARSVEAGLEPAASRPRVTSKTFSRTNYNNQRYHESIGNVTPADAYFGRHTAIIEKRKRIKKLTTQNRSLNHQRQAA